MARDYYGYSHSEEFKDVPITSVDDIRNLVVLCQDHHTGTSDTRKTGTGIHNMPEPYWLMQKNGKANPIIEDGETIADVEKRVD
jgi:hypothetical protein